MCTVTKKVCVFLYKKCVYYFIQIYLQSFIKILPLQYQNAFYAPDCITVVCVKSVFILGPFQIMDKSPSCMDVLCVLFLLRHTSI